jgi:hypothetical protein
MTIKATTQATAKMNTARMYQVICLPLHAGQRILAGAISLPQLGHLMFVFPCSVSYKSLMGELSNGGYFSTTRQFHSLVEFSCFRLGHLLAPLSVGGDRI